jgi:hypothetical protein
MTDRILIRGELSWWVHFFRVIAALTLVVGVVIGLAGFFAGWIVAGIGGVLWLALEAVAWKARRERTWLRQLADGFEVEDRTGRRTISDAQVTAAALESKRNLNNGEFSSTTRIFRVWTDERSEPIVMENTIAKDWPDPLADLVARLLDGLTQRLEDALERGGTVAGDGWRLTRGSLALGHPPSETTLALSEITAVETFDDKMCVWRRGLDEACAKLPLSGRNAYLLPALLRPRIPEQTDVGGAESPTGLGRVLFERRPQPALAVILIAIGGVMSFIGVILAATGRIGNDMLPLYLLIPGGLILVGAGVALKLSNFRCHERGVWQKSIFGQKMLRYSDIGSFTYGATRHYHNGAYTGTHLSMQFKPVSPQAGSAIRFSTTVQGDDDDLDELRNVISQAIAARMAGELAAGQPVAWTPNLEFAPQGIRYRPAGMFGRKEFEFLPFGSYGGHNMDQGVFYLFASGNPKPVTNEQCSAENFFPGFFLLLMLCHAPPENEPQAAAAAETLDLPPDRNPLTAFDHGQQPGR